MKQIKVNGIVIAENNMGDFDKMLTILTPNLGKIGCSARGARRPKSLLLAGTQFLCFGEYLLFRGSETYTINSCETIEMFYNIRIDLDKLTYASYITKIITDVTTENQNSFYTLTLFLNTLSFLACGYLIKVGYNFINPNILSTNILNIFIIIIYRIISYFLFIILKDTSIDLLYLL